MLRSRRAALGQDYRGAVLSAVERPAVKIGRYTLRLIPAAEESFIAYVNAKDWSPRPSAEIFDRRDVDAVIAEGVRAVVVDLDQAPLHSATVGALIRIRDCLAAVEGDLVLVATRKQRIILEMLQSPLESFENSRAALVSLLNSTSIDFR